MCDINCIQFGLNELSRDDVRGKRVLEVGSYDVNGSLRPGVMAHQPAEYIGVDIEKGPGVDIVCRATELVTRFGPDSFDIVISTCVLEHVDNWKLAVINMKRVCKPGGILILIVPSEWPWHNHPNDYWRYAVEDVKRIFSDFLVMVIEEKPSFHGPKQIGKLVYAKLKKPDPFVETNIGDYKLYSLPAGGKI